MANKLSKINERGQKFSKWRRVDLFGGPESFCHIFFKFLGVILKYSLYKFQSRGTESIRDRNLPRPNVHHLIYE